MIDKDELDKNIKENTVESKYRGELHTDGADYELHEELGSFRNEPVTHKVGQPIVFNPDAFGSMRRGDNFTLGINTKWEDEDGTENEDAAPVTHTAPRQEGKIETILGCGDNKGVKFNFSLPLTKCDSCRNFQPVLLGIKPCRRDTSEITIADFGFYSNYAGCPYFEFGMDILVYDTPHIQADGVSDQMGVSDVIWAEEALDTDRVRGALIALCGGNVTGPQASTVKLVGPVRREPGIVQADDDDEDDTFNFGNKNTNNEVANIGDAGSDTADVGGQMDEEQLACWFDGETSARPDGEPATHELVRCIDRLPLADRNAMIAQVYVSTLGGTVAFDDAVNACAELINYAYENRTEEEEDW